MISTDVLAYRMTEWIKYDFIKSSKENQTIILSFPGPKHRLLMGLGGD